MIPITFGWFSVHFQLTLTTCKMSVFLRIYFSHLGAQNWDLKSWLRKINLLLHVILISKKQNFSIHPWIFEFKGAVHILRIKKRLKYDPPTPQWLRNQFGKKIFDELLGRKCRCESLGRKYVILIRKEAGKRGEG